MIGDAFPTEAPTKAKQAADDFEKHGYDRDTSYVSDEYAFDI